MSNCNDAAPQPLAYSIPDAVRVSGLGRSTIYNLLAEGRLAKVKIGKRTLIPAASLAALVSGMVA